MSGSAGRRRAASSSRWRPSATTAARAIYDGFAVHLDTGQAAIPMTTAVAEQKDVPLYVRGIGTVQALNTAVIKTRVDGEIVKVAFQEGQDVKAGDPLFQIDPRPFQAALDEATATQTRNQAQLVGAELDLNRYIQMANQGFQSLQLRDQQQAKVDALKASIAADEAIMHTARLNLRYADIRAPFDGRTGTRLVDVGLVAYDKKVDSDAAYLGLQQLEFWA